MFLWEGLHLQPPIKRLEAQLKLRLSKMCSKRITQKTFYCLNFGGIENCARLTPEKNCRCWLTRGIFHAALLNGHSTLEGRKTPNECTGSKDSITNS